MGFGLENFKKLESLQGLYFSQFSLRSAKNGP